MLIRTATRNLLVLTISVLVCLLGLQVVLRYFFSISLIWADEVSRILFVWASFLGLFLAYERAEIPALTIVVDALPARSAMLIRMSVNVICAAFLLIVAYYGYLYADRVGGEPIPALIFIVGRDWAPSVFWVYAALPVGFALLAVRMAVDVFVWGRSLATGEVAELSDGGHHGGSAL